MVLTQYAICGYNFELPLFCFITVCCWHFWIKWIGSSLLFYDSSGVTNVSTLSDQVFLYFHIHYLNERIILCNHSQTYCDSLFLCRSLLKTKQFESLLTYFTQIVGSSHTLVGEYIFRTGYLLYTVKIPNYLLHYIATFLCYYMCR